MSVTSLLDSVWAPCPQPPCPAVASARMHHSGGQTCWEDASVTMAGDESLSAPAGRRLRMKRAALCVAELAQTPRGQALVFFCHHGQSASPRTAGVGSRPSEARGRGREVSVGQSGTDFDSQTGAV